MRFLYIIEYAQVWEFYQPMKTFLNDLPFEWGFILTKKLYFPCLSDSENMSSLVKKTYKTENFAIRSKSFHRSCTQSRVFLKVCVQSTLGA